MFAVIYRSYIKPGLENEYQALWNQVASFFIQYRGALGSCLHKTEEGIWLAYSRWPDKATRDASWFRDTSNSNNDMPEAIGDAITKMKNCGIEDCELPEICMEIIDDLLLEQPRSLFKDA